MTDVEEMPATIKTLVAVATIGSGSTLFAILSQLNIILETLLLLVSLIAVVLLVILRYRRYAKNQTAEEEE